MTSTRPPPSPASFPLALTLLLTSACAAPGATEQDAAQTASVAAPDARAGGTDQAPLVGPWRMQCFIEDELVLDVPEVYRTRRPGRRGGWIYVTADGTVVRGRIAAGASCVWTRLSDDPPVPSARSAGE